MSRCRACNKKMTELELCRKVFSPVLQKLVFLDLCTHCSQEEDELVTYYQRKRARESDDN